MIFSEEVVKQRQLVIGHLIAESKGMVNRTLLDGNAAGVGFHSAEPHPVERQAVEGAFKRNIISALCCTSTLAAGVNLPASRVIIRSPWNGNVFLSGANYLQMIGRCGRTNSVAGETDVAADSFILIQPNDVARFQNLVQSPVEPIERSVQSLPAERRPEGSTS